MTANNDLIVSYPGFFVSEFREGALWLKFSGNFFHNFLSFDNRNSLHDFFDQLAANRDIKTVVIQSAFHESGSDEYMRFFLFECPERDLGHFGFSNTMDRYDLHRYCNVIDRTVMDIFTMNKIIIHICSGDVLSLFMNISLACDYRIVADDTVFHNIFHEIGMLPKGGGPFFLSRSIGTGRAKSIMLQQRITAKEALDNNIADLVVSPDDLETAALDLVRRFGQIPSSTLFGLKRLANYSFRELENYLEYETQEIIKIGHRQDFSDQ
ncbi:2-(1,2-epoxy-1,2-dihydrophenyl)acetyl-CoA isomerase [Desulfosarcina ovata subsp. sediminis]|uniref:2-(1,2-epoxy-1,2-dihydrophenyl)acetyl-CoA isomerase n=1 Tax=Desulfosarcina ovata subsp. sediminis TaxID=885957 RepID=A0A5K7ZJH8_9BACT|nr:enoyl-CoA hydratase/isomerase family protein [Desulfosarcina ovata]BBO81156.1 2-(1,2-epoxy-1,2-dihydrophenyl)acetyl-CoA isomerase [Desulfosarcina ovata subsp. sediminis]